MIPRATWISKGTLNLSIDRLRLKHHMARLVGLTVGAGHTVGVGEIGGDHVQALALRLYARTGDIENIEERHDEVSLTVFIDR